MASNSPPQLPREEVMENEESEDEDDEDYEPAMGDDMADSHPDLEYLQFLAAWEAERRAAELAPETVIVVDSDEETEGEDSDNEQSVGNVVVESSVVKGRGLGVGGGSEVSDKENVVELDRSSIPSCPVCFESWSSEGPHRVCCIPCGHVYGRSCLERWFNQSGKNIGKCPQCNRKFRKKEIVSLYAPLIAVANDDLQKEVRCLREENKSLKLEKVGLIEEINKHKKHARDAENSSRHKMACLEHTFSSSMMRHFECSGERWTSTTQSFLENSFASQKDDTFHQCHFALQNELELDGARVMGIDESIVIVSGKSPGFQQEHVLTKISLLSPSGVDSIQLPPNTKAIRDVSILSGGLALLASLGKKLLLFSMTSNNLVHKYDLPAPAWSCSGDDDNPHYIYTGLQNGMLMVFDIRQTAEPMQVIEGFTRHPVHTVHSIGLNDGNRRVLTASSSGPCVWEVGSSCERTLLIPEMENRGVCISLACSGSLDGAVASYRPKVELSGDLTPSPTPLSPSPPLSTPGKIGSHILIKRASSSSFQYHEIGKSIVSELRMPKSAILCKDGSNSLFAYGDESSHGVHVWGLPSFDMYAKLKPHQQPILDVRCNPSSSGRGFLGCISENRLQVYSCFPC